MTIIANKRRLQVMEFGVYLPELWLRHAGGPEPIMQTVYPKCSLLKCFEPATHERAAQMDVCNHAYGLKVYFCDAHDPVELLAASTMAVTVDGE